MNSLGTIHKEVIVPLPLARAFELFTSGFSEWWPKEYTWSQHSLVKILLEAKKGGRCYEIGPHDFQCQFGRVLSCDPPHEIKFTWQISPDSRPQPNPENASEVQVRFVAEGEHTTKVILSHSLIEHHGQGAEDYFNGLNSEQGWSWILQHYVAKATKES